jgi:hypothetical protein
MRKESEQICFAVFGDGCENIALADLADALLARQKTEWAALAAGHDALESVRIREIEAGDCRVRAQFNPGRIVSSGAALDPESIRKRPCFLCRENLPPEQQAIRYRDEYLILCNPAPIFPAHWTVAHVRHLPQSIENHIEIFLRLAEDFGPRAILLYNGPRCGASAPDHLHFQAAQAGLMPVEAESLDPRKRAGTLRRDGAVISRIAGMGRGILVIEGPRRQNVASAMMEVIGVLGRATVSDDEPMMNLLGSHTPDGWRLIVFPRRKQRPDIYFREEGKRRVISPGAVEMGGIMVTPREEDFLALTPDLVLEIYDDVAFDDAAIENLFALL